LPPNGLEVKTSTRVKGVFLSIPRLCRAVAREPIEKEKRRAVEGPPLREFGKSALAYLPTMKTQLVVPLPPMFSIANFFAFSTW
jgi:hypothetical protein